MSIFKLSDDSEKYEVKNFEYDPNGNIEYLDRYDQAGILMDDLEYKYHGNRLRHVADAGTQNGFANSTTGDNSDINQPSTWEYSYDRNGNILSDDNRGITVIEYNFQNLPTYVQVSSHSLNYAYSAAGTKLRFTGTTDQHTDYIGPFVYQMNGSVHELSYILTPEGRALPNANGFTNEYHLRDHLGNTRVVFWDLDGSGSIDPATEVKQVTDYYPFGMMHYTSTGLADQPYLYNGKELQEGTEWYDFGFRFYDPSIARFSSMDPLAEKFYWVSPFNYAENRPVDGVDFWGLQYIEYDEVAAYNYSAPSITVSGFNPDGTYNVEFSGGGSGLVANGDGTYNFDYLGEPYSNISYSNYDGIGYLNVGQHITDNYGNTLTTWIWNPVPETMSIDDWVAYKYELNFAGFEACAGAAAKGIYNATGSIPGHFWINDHKSLQMYTDNYLTVNSTTRSAGLDAIMQSLENGNPIMVGVDYAPQNGSDRNSGTDWTTDHYVDIHNRGYDAGGVFFLFSESVADNDAGWGMSDVHKLYLQSDGTLRTIKREASYNGLFYTVTQVRPIK